MYFLICFNESQYFLNQIYDIINFSLTHGLIFIMLLKVLFLILISAFWLGSFECFAQSFNPSFLNQTNANNVEQILNQMTLDEKIGQVFIFGFPGQDFSTDLNDTLKQLKPGALIVFSRNIKNIHQIAKLNYQIQMASITNTGIPLLLAVDQEGGTVTRIQVSPPVPSGLAIGMTNNNELSEQVGFVTGSILKILGFNMNLAPVLDLSDPNIDSFIGTRSFGNSPKLVSEITNSYSEGLIKAEILPTAKHFPGHGGISADSHKVTPVLNKSKADLFNTDLYPFSHFLPSLSNKAIMIAHLAYPEIDPTRSPATFSKTLTELFLRTTLNYNGLVITDDIEMAGAKIAGSPGDRAAQAFNAGSDLIMVAWSKKAQHQAFLGLKKAVESGQISKNRLNSSVRRILLAKKQFASQKPQPPSTTEITKYLNRSLIKDTYDRVLTLNINEHLYSVQSRLTQLPEHIYVLSARKDFIAPIIKAFNKINVAPVLITRQSKIHQLEALIKSKKNSFFVYYVSSQRTAQLLNKLNPKAKKRILVINATLPGKIEKSELFSGLVNIYYHHPNSGQIILERLFPKFVRNNPISQPLRAPAQKRKL